jgi:hypothetical protein
MVQSPSILDFRFRSACLRQDFGLLAANTLSAKAQPHDWIISHLALLVGYLLLALLLTWPTVTHLTTHLPGDGGDDPAIAWNLWWVKYALLNEGQNPFQTNFMFYPIGINLAFYTLTALNAVTALPLTLNFGVIAAGNLHLLFTFVVGGYGAFLLARYVLLTEDRRPEPGDRLADSRPRPFVFGRNLVWVSAAIAGGFYTFASNKLFYVALGQYNIASTHWIPFTVLYLLRTRHDPYRLKYPLMAGLFLTLQAWTEITYASFLLVFIALYWIWEMGCGIRDMGYEKWELRRRLTHSQFPIPNSQFPILPHLRAIIILALTFAIGLSPILAQILPDLRAEGDFWVEGSGFAESFSADLLGFITPTMLHPWLGHFIRQTNIGAPGSATGFDKGQHIYLGFVFLGLLLVSILTGYRRAGLRFWLVAVVIFALLCLGPVITINGHSTGLPGPFNLLQSLPFFKGNRYPSRFSVMLILSLSVIAAFALAGIGQWANRQRSIISSQWSTANSPSTIYYILSTIFFLLFLFEHLSIPLPQSDMQSPLPYQIIADTPGDFTVLDIPFAWRNGFRITGALTTQFMLGQFYQTVHQKKLLQGNTSRNPQFKFQYFTNAPLINSLLALETGKTLPPKRWEADRAIAAEILSFFNIKYIVVRPYQYDKFDGQKNTPVTEQATLPYIEQVLPIEKIHDEATIKIYRVKDTSIPESKLQSGLLIGTAHPLAPLYFGEGWGLLTSGRPVTAQRQEARLLLPLTGAPQRLTLRVRLPANYSGDWPQSLQLSLNGWQSPLQTISQEWQDLTFDLPAGVARPGLNDLWLHFAGVIPLPQHAALPQSGGKTEVWTPEITVLSAGEEVGDFGHIFVNGHDISPNQRGYNVAIVQPDGALQTAAFDTHLDLSASVALAEFMTAAPADAIIAVAVADEASANLSEEAVRALQAIGAKGDLRGCFRCSHAFIRTPSGATFEALEALRPVGVTTGLGLTEPGLAAEVEWIKLDPVE